MKYASYGYYSRWWSWKWNVFEVTESVSFPHKFDSKMYDITSDRIVVYTYYTQEYIPPFKVVRY